MGDDGDANPQTLEVEGARLPQHHTPINPEGKSEMSGDCNRGTRDTPTTYAALTGIDKDFICIVDLASRRESRRREDVRIRGTFRNSSSAVVF